MACYFGCGTGGSRCAWFWYIILVALGVASLAAFGVRTSQCANTLNECAVANGLDRYVNVNSQSDFIRSVDKFTVNELCEDLFGLAQQALRKAPASAVLAPAPAVVAPAPAVIVPATGAVPSTGLTTGAVPLVPAPPPAVIAPAGPAPGTVALAQAADPVAACVQCVNTFTDCAKPTLPLMIAGIVLLLTSLLPCFYCCCCSSAPASSTSKYY